MIDDMSKYTVCVLDENNQLGQGGCCSDRGKATIEGKVIHIPNKLDIGSNGWKSFVYKPPDSWKDSELVTNKSKLARVAAACGKMTKGSSSGTFINAKDA